MTQHQAEAEPHPIEPELSKQEPSEGHLNPNTTLPLVLRILDNENRLAERADQKAISLLSVLGVFMVFFIVNIRSIPLNLATVVLMTAYVIAAFAAIMHLVLTIKPRIRKGLEAVRDDSSLNTRPEVAFFAGICAFPTLTTYNSALCDLLKDENAVKQNYIRQIYNVAQINQLKYRYVQRAAVIVLTALGIELSIVAYLFSVYMGTGHVP